MKAAQLRQSILQAAVQGKLVPQNVHDEPASELLKRIQQEKVRLVKEGKINKEKSLPLIAEDEIPYDLPDGWVWCRLGDICSHIADIDHNMPSAVNTGGVLFLSAKDLLDNGTINFTDKVKCISEDDYERLSKKIKPQRNDIIYSRIGACLGKARIVNSDIRFLVSYSCCTIRSLSVNLQYLCRYLDSGIVLEQATRDTQSIGVPDLGLKRIKEFLVPLPSLAEQKRIVAKVDELMALCDELEAAEKDLGALESRFAEYLPKSIMQAAVQGKLVPQNVHDEPATVLLECIRQEKARLIRENKIKKEKPLLPITEDETPYDLPEGWVWCRLGDIVNLTRGITFPSSAKSKELIDGFIRCATTGSVQKEYNSSADVFVPASYVKKENQWLQKNDIMMSSANSKELVGKSCIWNAIERTAFGGFLTIIRSYSAISLSYLHYGLQYLQKSGIFASYSTQTTNIANLNNDMINNTLFPLPPLAEQLRIVAKVDELMALCDELKVAKDISLKRTLSNVVLFPQQGEDAEELAMVARGDGSRKHSKKLQQVIDELLEDDEDE